MLAEAVGAILVSLLEGLVEAAAEILLELGWLSVKASIASEREVPAILAWLGLFLVGAGLGGGSVYLWPHRFIAPGRPAARTLIAS